MTRILLAFGLAALVAACAQFPGARTGGDAKGVYVIREPFNVRDFAWAMNQGSATVTGRAVLRGADGRHHSCAGNTVALTADNAYTREGAEAAKTHLYSRIERDPRYYQYRRTTTCDAQGNFTFRHLPHGNWGIGTRVEWEEKGPQGRVVRGGPLGRTFRLRAGESATITMSDRDL